jgi:hypothetical protein
MQLLLLALTLASAQAPQAVDSTGAPPTPPSLVVQADASLPTFRPELGPAALTWSSDSAAVVAAPGDPARAGSAADTVRRPKPIEYSNGYTTRLAIHKYASYATIPLFVAEYFLGQSLYNDPDQRGATRSAHVAVAAGIGVLFGVNTITGGWNLWESRKDPAGRARRYIHSGLMLLSDAGFVWAGTIAPGEHARPGTSLDDQRRKHRTVALSSFGVSLASYLMMLVWKE